MIEITSLPDNPLGTLALSPDYLKSENGGWKIFGKVHEDDYKFINDFVAMKFINEWDADIVCGNFEDRVFASSQEAYDDFIINCLLE